MGRRIILLGPNLEGGGAQTVLRGWSSALVASGHDVVVAVTEVAEHELPGAEVRLLGKGGRGGTWRKLRELRSLVRGSDAVIAQMPYWNLLAIVAVLLLPHPERPGVVVSEHNLYAGLRRIMGQSLRTKALVARMLYRRADAFIAVSHAVAAEVASAYRVPADRIWVVPNTTIPNATLGAEQGASGRSDGELSIVFAGRFVPQKDPELVIETAARIASRSVPVRVHFYGYGPMQSDLERLAAERGVPTEFHGMVPEWWRVAPPGGVLLLPSSVEGFGNVLVEATAAGLPTVASSQAMGVADAILDGVTGILAPARTSEAFADAVLRARDLRPIPDVSGWLHKFTPAAGAVRLEEVLRTVTK